MDTNISFTDVVLNTIQEKRDFLKKLSAAVAPMIQAGEFDTTNQAVMHTFYIDSQHTTFKTFNEWKKDGYSIKKGSKAFLVWGKPAGVQDAEKAAEKGRDEEPTDDEREFYPIAFLFSNAQVERRARNV